MQNSSGNKIKLGIFVSAGIALFIIGIYLIGEKQQLFNKTFQVSGIFHDIGGLQAGNNVRFSGINVGIVDAIEQVTDSTVRVYMNIDNKSKKFIKKDAKAIIGSDGLMGNKIVVITPGAGASKEIEDHDVIATQKPITMDDILAKIKVTSDNAADITTDLATVMRNIKQGKGTIGKLFIDTSMARNIDQTIVNIKQGTGGLKQTMEAANHNFLLRGYFKRKERKEQRKKQEMEEVQKDKIEKKK